MSDGHVVTSAFVRDQFKATFLRCAVLLYNVLVEHGNIPDAGDALDKRPTRPGDGVKARKILWSAFRETDADFDSVLSVLERWIESEILEVFEDGVQLIDGTECCKSPGGATRDRETGVYRFSSSCTLDDPRPCTIEKFWSGRERHLVTLSGLQLEKLPEHVADAVTAATEVVRDKKPPRGFRCYYALSDAVILSEAPSDLTLATTNVKDFVALSPCVERKASVENPLVAAPPPEAPG